MIKFKHLILLLEILNINKLYMEKVIPLYNENVLDVTSNLKIYLEATFDLVYNYNNFFIVANNDPPYNSMPDATGELIWLKIIDYVKTLMIKPSSAHANLFYSKLSANYILAYGTYSFINDKYKIILDKFNKKLVPIYTDSQLNFIYMNDYITIQKLDSILWKPINSQLNNNYNTILETVLKIIFDTLSITYTVDWSFNKLDYLYIILNRDIENGYHIPVTYEIPKALKNYIYQVWILTLHKYEDILSPEQKKIETLLYKYKDKGIPLDLTINQNFSLINPIENTNTNKLMSQTLDYTYNLSMRILFFIVIVLIIILIIILLYILEIF